MDDQDTPIIITLHIIEGIGLHVKNESVVITASISGNKVETEIINTANPTNIDTKLVYEAVKKDIKKIKAENLPIKVECFIIHDQSSPESREYIGYVLLSLRNIPIQMNNKTQPIKPHWHKLIGLSYEWRSRKPELLMSVSIISKIQHFKEEEQKIINEKTSSDHGIFVQLLENEGIIQVGDAETDCDVFAVRVLLDEAKDFDKMIPEKINNQPFHIEYNLFGSPCRCVLKRTCNGNYLIRERFTIHFRSSLERLTEYFNKIFEVPIDIFYSSTVIGHVKLYLKNLLNFESASKFIEEYGLESDNHFEVSNHCLVTPLQEQRNNEEGPRINFVFSLKYKSKPKILPPAATNRSIHLDSGGDTSCAQIILSPESITHSPPTKLNQNRELEASKAKPKKTEVIDHPQITKSSPKTIENIPRTYIFSLILDNVKFSSVPDSGIWQISFHHPKADTPYTLVNVEISNVDDNLINFQQLEMQLYFSTMAEEIMNVIKSESSLLSIIGPHGLCARAELDNESLILGTKKQEEGILLMENQSGEKVAMANVSVKLNELGINYNSQSKKFSTTAQPQSSHLDEKLAYKIVEELEEWKLKQQEQFLTELRRKETVYLERLSNEWEKKRHEEEMKLAEKLEDLTTLTAVLEEQHKNRREQNIQHLDNEKSLALEKSELEQSYLQQMFTLKENARRIEDDMKHQIKLAELKYKEIEMNNKMLARENERLRETIIAFEVKIIEMQQSLFPKEQIDGLIQELKSLNEKLDRSEKSKIFYKEQWAKIIRQVHRTKSENLHQLNSQHLQNKTTGMKEILENECCELDSERNELHFIKQSLSID